MCPGGLINLFFSFSKDVVGNDVLSTTPLSSVPILFIFSFQFSVIIRINKRIGNRFKKLELKDEFYFKDLEIVVRDELEENSK